MPTKFTFSATKFIEILYDATGQKLRKKTTDGSTVTTQDYISGIELKNNRLESIYNEEGRAYNTTNATQSYPYNWRREYNLKDHLGNTRVVFSDKNANGVIDGTSEILQESHYYAFGMACDGSWMRDATADKYKYLYYGKELKEDLGLNLSDYGARWYDAAVGRSWSVDPLAQIEPNSTPYNYVSNNPLKFVDYFGMFGGEPDAIKGGEDKPTPLPTVTVTAKRIHKTDYSSGFYSVIWEQYEHQNSPNPFTFSHAQNEKIAAGITTVLTAGTAAEAGAIGYGFQQIGRGSMFLWNHRMGLGRLAMRFANKNIFAKLELIYSKIGLSFLSQGVSSVVKGEYSFDFADLGADIFLQPFVGGIFSSQIDITSAKGLEKAGDFSVSAAISASLGFASNRVEGLISSTLEQSSIGLNNISNFIGQTLQKLYFTAGNDVAQKTIPPK